jgi:hypothetical protein
MSSRAFEVKPLATYSFLPWLRQGIANTITDADGDHAIATRATTHVALQINGDPVVGGAELTHSVAQDVALYGPGDIVGIDERAIVRTEPHNWITNFESNYLAAIDFYDEDFPWRYTPAAPDAGNLRLRPWITLVVLAESEFSEGGNMSGRPLPYIAIPDTSVLPSADDLWAWAHVHVNQPLGAPGETVTADMSAVLPRLESIVAQNHDVAYSRLLCPRQLEADTAYHAFVIPTFETGRLAGIGEAPEIAPYATASAWETYAQRPQGNEFPFYYRWYFRTGSYGDFEYLARLLKPESVDSRVGTRNIDVTNPGSNIPGISEPALDGVLRLGGALQVPEADLEKTALEERAKYENWDAPYPDPFQKALAAFVNLADDYTVKPAATANAGAGIAGAIEEDPDPLVTAPLYARWHALTQRLLTERDGSPAPDDDNWVHSVNLDPRFRVAAGFGADVVENNAEQYMDDAWQQVGEVLKANAMIHRLHLASAVSSRWYDLHVTPLAAAQPERALALTAPVQSKVMASPTTVAYTRASSLLPPALTSTAMRRVLRPHGRLMRLLAFDANVTPANLLERINGGAVSTAVPLSVPAGVITVDEVASAAQPSDAPAPVLAVLARYAWLPWALIALGIVLLVVLALVLPLGIGLVIGLAILAALVLLAWRLWQWEREDAPALALQETDQTPTAVAHLPDNPTFTLSEPGAGHTTPTGSTDSPTAARLKEALADSFALLQASAAVGTRVAPSKLELPTLTTTVVAALDPTVTIPKRGFSNIQLPDWVSQELLGDYGEVMAYPKIDLPMYEPLKAISIELFLPNINLVAPDSVTLVETNQKFIESYMIGLNYEFGRKLLWRGFPTDERGSYFRQFWDVRSVINAEGLSENALKDKLYDIPPLNDWQRASKLGEHNNRLGEGNHGEQAVLVIRGELLKKFPTAVIYAQRAEWQYERHTKTPDLTEPRELVELSASEEQNPPLSKVRMPLYEAKADPDIYFFGFDLTIPEAQGGSGHPPDTDPGWFFVIKERPGEPRFGLELTREGPLEVLEELTWQDALPGGKPGQFLGAGSLASVALKKPTAQNAEEKQPQYEEDKRADAAAVSSARWAYLLFRVPAMVAIHADQMLRDKP